MRSSDFNKYNNLLNDSELKTSKHDEICLWLYEYVKNKDIIRKELSNTREIFGNHEKHTFYLSEITKVEPQLESEIIDNGRLVKKYSKIIGYYDLIARVSAVYNANTEIDSLDAYMCRYGNVKVISKSSFEVCSKVAFEVKTNLNVGETIRQLNYYSIYDDSRKIVVTPGNKYKSIIEDHGYGYIEYPH